MLFRSPYVILSSQYKSGFCTILVFEFQRAQLLNALDDAMKENAKLHEELGEVMAEHERMANQHDEILSEVKELEAEIANTNKLQFSLRQETEQLSKKANGLKDEIESANWALQEATAEHDMLRPQVVSSPDRHRANLEQTRQDLDSKKASSRLLEEQVRQCKTKLRNLQNVMSSLVQAKSQLDEYAVLASKYRAAVQKLDDAEKQIEKVKKQTSEQDSMTQQMARTLARQEEKLIHQRKQAELQLKAFNDALNNAKSQLLVVEKDRRQAMLRVESCEDELRALEERMNEERSAAERDIEVMMNEYRALQQAFLQRDEHRMNSIGAGDIDNEDAA